MTQTDKKWVEIPSKYGTGFEKIVADGILRIHFHPRWRTYFYYVKIVDGKRIADGSFSFHAQVANEKAAKQHISRRYENRNKPIKNVEREPIMTDENARMKKIVRQITNAIYDADLTLGNPIDCNNCEYLIGTYFVLMHVPMSLYFEIPDKKTYMVLFGTYAINENDHPQRYNQGSERFDSLDDAEKAVNELCKRAVEELIK